MSRTYLLVTFLLAVAASTVTYVAFRGASTPASHPHGARPVERERACGPKCVWLAALRLVFRTSEGR
jgi:hypothetical protein